MEMPDLLENDGHPPAKKAKKTFSSSESSSFDNTWIHTKSNVLNARLIWKITNFSFVGHQAHRSINSEVFSAAANANIKWSVQLMTNPKLSESSSELPGIEMTLKLIVNWKTELKAQFRFIIYDRTMNEAKVVSKSHVFTQRCPSVSVDMYSQKDVICADSKILSNDELTIGCEVKYLNTIVNTVVLNGNPEFLDTKHHCINILELMFKNQELSDCKINIGGQTFQAHKAILAAASPVFLAMFKSSMTETQQNSINIDDIDAETFEEMLRFIYTGNVNNIENLAYTLFATANKYAIDTLKHECERKLSNSLTVENAVEVLILADLHNSDWLKAHVIKFIKLESIGVTKTESFNSMIDSHRHLHTEIMSALASK